MTGNNTDTARIGLETGWGDSIVEVSVNGTEYVNRHDTGREIRLSFRDGSRPYWNPTMGGDEDNQGAPTLAWTLNPESIYTKSQPLEWYVEENSGGVGRSIMEDAGRADHLRGYQPTAHLQDTLQSYPPGQ